MAINVRSKLSFVIVLLAVLAGHASSQELPFRLISGNRLVVTGTVAGQYELSVLIDTGADCSIISRDSARRMKLRILAKTVRYSALGRTSRAQLTVVENLRVGPISTSLACIVGEIQADGVDMILGLHVLRKHNFAIDYEHTNIVFDPSYEPVSPVPFEPDSNLIVVNATVRGETVRALVDTGASSHCVFEESGIVHLLDYTGFVTRTPYLGGNAHSAEIVLSSLTIGSTEWKELDATALKNPAPLPWDMVLSVGKLGLKQVYFDFTHRALSWRR